MLKDKVKTEARLEKKERKKLAKKRKREALKELKKQSIKENNFSETVAIDAKDDEPPEEKLKENLTSFGSLSNNFDSKDKCETVDLENNSDDTKVEEEAPKDVEGETSETSGSDPLTKKDLEDMWNSFADENGYPTISLPRTASLH